MSSKIKDIQEKPVAAVDDSMSKQREQRVARRKEAKDVQQQFDSAFREVVNFGGKALTGKDKQEAKKKALQDTGRLLPKNEKMPYRLLVKSRKKNRLDAKKQEELLRAAGMVGPDKKKKSTRSTNADFRNRKPGDGSRGIKESIGTFRGGVLHLTKKDFSSVKR